MSIRWPFITRRAHKAALDAAYSASTREHERREAEIRAKYRAVEAELAKLAALSMRCQMQVGHFGNWRMVIEIADTPYLEHGNSDLMIECMAEHWTRQIIQAVKGRNCWRERREA